MTLDSRYRAIQQRVEAMTDFSDQTLAPSRALFDFEGTDADSESLAPPQSPYGLRTRSANAKEGGARRRPVPKKFDVWTNLVGLPLPSTLTQAFQAVWNQVERRLPDSVRFYPVRPSTYHWELFIIKRPDETVSLADLQRSGAVMQQILAQQPPFSLTYRGFLITPDGTVLIKGYGEFDALRAQLRDAFPWASVKQSQLGHVSLGRILDPVGSETFALLNQQVEAEWDHEYGSLTVDQVKWVHEAQWYMEQHEIVAELTLGS